ncbi:MAG: hypothetical protein ABIK19_04470 [candidate division WOR-3 bacterium]
MYRKIICLCLALMFLVRTSVGQQDIVSQARMDAEVDAKSDVNSMLWMGAGCVLGVVGILVAYLVEPSPPASRLMGKSPEYVTAYTDHYKSVSKSEQGKKAITGCAIGYGLAAIVYVIYVALIAAAVTAGTATTY